MDKIGKIVVNVMIGKSFSEIIIMLRTKKFIYCAGHNYTTEPQMKTIFFAEQSPEPDFEAKRRLFSRF